MEMLRVKVLGPDQPDAIKQTVREEGKAVRERILSKLETWLAGCSHANALF